MNILDVPDEEPTLPVPTDEEPALPVPTTSEDALLPRAPTPDDDPTHKELMENILDVPEEEPALPVPTTSEDALFPRAPTPDDDPTHKELMESLYSEVDQDPKPKPREEDSSACNEIRDEPLPPPSEGEPLPCPREGEPLPRPREGEPLPRPREGEPLPCPREDESYNIVLDTSSTVYSIDPEQQREVGRFICRRARECYVELRREISRDPHRVAEHLFQHSIITEDELREAANPYPAHMKRAASLADVFTNCDISKHFRTILKAFEDAGVGVVVRIAGQLIVISCA